MNFAVLSSEESWAEETLLKTKSAMSRLDDLGQRSGAIAIDEVFDKCPLNGYARNRVESHWL